MRWLGPDLCQVSVPLLESLWAHADTQLKGQACHESQRHENNYVLCSCMMETFPLKVIKPVIIYPVVIAL